MFAKFLTSTSLVAAISLTPIAAPAPVHAQDAREILGGLLIGGAIGYGIAASQQPRTQVIVPQQPPPTHGNPTPQQPRPQTTYQPPRTPAIPATEAGRQVQTALNYFGFDAGYVDGQVGPATRAAVERYQRAQGYPVNGSDFPEAQARYLIGAYLWATEGGQQQTGLSGTPLLAAYQGVLEGRSFAGAPQQPGNTTVIVNPGTTTVLPAPGTGGAPVTTATGPTTGGVPNLFAGASGDPALSAACDRVALAAQANGGMMHLSNLSNPGTALTEQFCTARAGAVDQGHQLTQSIPGLTYTQIAAQCEGFSAAVAGQAGLIGSVHPTQVVAAANGFAITTGIPAAELAATARVCLGIGYSADDMQMAMGSALMLVATGEAVYGELIGHHLREGAGVAANEHLAHAWYDMAIGALERGETAVFSPNDLSRTALLRQAVGQTFGGAPAVPQPVSAPAPAQIPVIPNAASFAPQNVPAPAPIRAPTPAPAPVASAPTPVNPQPNIQPLIVEPVISAQPPIAAAPAPEPDIAPLFLPTFQVQQ